jgi:colicin import membrane protein
VIRDSKNFIPVSMAVLLHVIIFSSMIVAFDYARPMPFTPLAIQATLVTEIPDKAPPPPPVVEPEPEPVIEEPEPEPDNSEELRREAEEEKRRLDALLEQQRLDELQKKEAEDKKRKEREEAEREKREEEEKERQRVEAERKRQEDIERQRQENERLRRELEAEQRQTEIDDEERRLAAASSPAMAVYQNMIMQDIQRKWAMPASVTPDTSCVVMVRQTGAGVVISARIASCNGDEAVKRSIVAAVEKASPLPTPSDPDLFRPELRITMRPPQ